jgi:pimeloyl-ACP methyl ester carboxylesterase
VVLAIGLAGCSAGSPPPSATTTAPTTPATAPTLGPDQDLVVGGRHFHARCAGAGRAVLLVSGYGLAMEEAWSSVHTTLGTLGRVCAYDRLGVGQSDAPPDRQTFEDMARDLDGVVSALHLDRPVVVGHSLGGAVAATWAAAHGDRARALVLLDPSPPGYQAVFDSMLPQRDSGDLAVDSFLRDLAEFDDPRTNLESLDPRAWDEYARLGRIATPLEVLVRGRAEADPPGMDGPALESAWLSAQRRLVALSDRGRLTTAESSGHFVAGDRPDLVVAAVKAALAP